ncbi:LysM peptidoglycan-binding domain-containing protein [Dorea sp.]
MERQLPKNVRQIGNVSDTPKVYVEDYVDTYLNQLKEKAKDQPAGIILAGEMLDLGDEKAVFVSGAVQLKELQIKGTTLEITEEVLTAAREEVKEFFPECEVVGWGIVEDGSPLSRNREVKRIQEKEFASEMSLFLWKNAREPEEIFYAYKFGELMQMGGHYIYYEKNPQMQNYMINNRRANGVTPSEVVEDRAAKDFRSAVKEKMENRSQQGRRPGIAYITSALLVLVVFAAGITTVNNFGKMKAMQTSVENLSKTVENGQKKGTTETATVDKTQENEKSASEAVKKSEATKTSDKAEAQLSDQDYYVVQKGETLAGISKKLYGDTTHVKAICKMNGLSDGNLIYIGQKLLLP